MESLDDIALEISASVEWVQGNTFAGPYTRTFALPGKA